MLRAALNRVSRLKASLKMLRSPSPSSPPQVSSDYVVLRADEAESEGARLRDAWLHEDLPTRQRALVDSQLALYRAGNTVDVFDTFVAALRSLPVLRDGASLLEIGCSSGYYAEVLRVAGLPLRYTGCDYSEAFIALARQIYPGIPFAVEDAAALSYETDGFDIVVSGCCLLHIPDYERAIAETARVARDFVIFHRTPLMLGAPTKHFRKRAYGIETVEIQFGEAEFLALMAHHGLVPLTSLSLSETPETAIRTYVCRKRRP